MNKLLPQNTDAEKELLGALFYDQSLYFEFDLRPEYFYLEKHEFELFRKMLLIQLNFIFFVLDLRCKTGIFFQYIFFYF